MSTSNGSPRETMEAVWAAFASGRAAEVPEQFFAPDATIKVEGAPHVPFVGEFSGADQHVEFFKLGGAEVQQFDVKQMVAEGEDVVTLGYFDWLVSSTGRHYKGDWALHTRIVGGRIVLWQMYEDSWSVGQAFDE